MRALQPLQLPGFAAAVHEAYYTLHTTLAVVPAAYTIAADASAMCESTPPLQLQHLTDRGKRLWALLAAYAYQCAVC